MSESARERALFDIFFIMESKKRKLDIPVEGSLGLLALGATGIIAWRKVRNAHKLKEESGEKNTDGEGGKN